MHALLSASLVLVLAGSHAAQQPRDRPAPVNAEAQLEGTLRAQIASGRALETVYLQLAELLRGRGALDEGDALTLQRRDKFPASAAAHAAAALVYNRRGDFENTIASLREAARYQPDSAEARHRIAVFFWDRTRSDPKLDPATSLSYVMQGIEAETEALTINPDYVEALTYKNVLLRLKANLTPDPAERAQLIAEADELRNRALALQRQSGARPSPPAAEPSAFSGFAEPFDQAVARLSPVRVGRGTIRPPVKIRDVRPQYPIDALRQRVQGVVIMEAVIDESGAVANAQIVRSVPMLDAAALDSVRQWVFTPTEINGRAVPVLMTVTVNFALQPR